ncbi:MAG: STAS domain-containing protein [Acidobacteriaceae bacterium]
MAVRFDRSEGPGVVRLEGEIGIADAAQLKEILQEALRAGAEARIALETASSLDVTAVQLLWAAERAAQAAGVPLALEGTFPENLRASLREAGFERLPFVADGADAARPANGGRL